jgi:hypothetical protein
LRNEIERLIKKYLDERMCGSLKDLKDYLETHIDELEIKTIGEICASLSQISENWQNEAPGLDICLYQIDKSIRRKLEIHE